MHRALMFSGVPGEERQHPADGVGLWGTTAAVHLLVRPSGPHRLGAQELRGNRPHHSLRSDYAFNKNVNTNFIHIN